MRSKLVHGVKLSILLTVLSLFLPLVSMAEEDGPRTDGGTDKMVEEFVKIANKMIREVPFARNHKYYLKKAMLFSKIEAVHILVDQKTGEPVRNQNSLIAWGSPGLIQLKKANLNKMDWSWEEAIKGKNSIAHIVAHELFRSSGFHMGEAYGKRSVDDIFQISIGVYHLNEFTHWDVTGPSLEPRLSPMLTPTPE